MTDGDGDGIGWTDPQNFDSDTVVPVNDAVDSFAVVIPAGFTSIFDVPDPIPPSPGVISGSAINSLSLGTLTQFKIMDPVTLTVLGDTNISSSLISIQGGGKLIGSSIPTAYTSANLGGTSRTLISVTDPGSRLDLPSVTEFDANFSSSPFQATQSVIIANGAAMDLSGVTAIHAPQGSGDRLDLVISNTDSTLDLSLLETLSGNGRGITRFVLSDGADLSLPSLQSADRATFFLSGGATLRANGSTPASYASVIQNSGGTILSATDPGTLLDLSAVTDINAQFNSTMFTPQIQTITAAGGASIDLSGVTAIHAPADLEDRLDIVISDAASTIDLSSLQSLTGPGNGATRFSLSNGATVSLPSLQTADRAIFLLSGGATLSINDVGPVTLASNTQSFAGTILSAADAGTILDLSSVTDFDAGFNTSTASTAAQIVTATSGGVIDLSALTTVHAPVDPEDRLDIVVNGSTSSIELDSLDTVTGPGAGVIRFNLSNQARVSLPALQTADRTAFFLSGGATLIANGPAPIYYASYNQDRGATIMSATGPGTLLDLSALIDINARFKSPATGSHVQTITATNRATIDLSGLKFIHAPTDSEDVLQFDVDDFSLIDISSITRLRKAGSGSVRFMVSGGGRLRLGQVTNTSGGEITLTEPGSTLETLGLVLQDTSSLIADSGTTIQMGGSLIFHHMDETKFDVDQATVQFDGSGHLCLEVGGLDLFTLPTADNFGIGELIVGGSGVATELTLVDVLDNGNRGGGSEALYIFGIDGGNGLSLLDGSILNVGSLDVYAVVEGTMTHLNSLGSGLIPYDSGFLDFTHRLNGDLNGDGFVGIDDLTLVLGNWGRHVPLADPLFGDAFKDGYIGIDDLNIVLGNWNTGTPPADVPTSVPEPGTFAMMGVAGFASVRRIRRY